MHISSGLTISKGLIISLYLLTPVSVVCKLKHVPASLTHDRKATIYPTPLLFQAPGS